MFTCSLLLDMDGHAYHFVHILKVEIRLGESMGQFFIYSI